MLSNHRKAIARAGHSPALLRRNSSIGEVRHFSASPTNSFHSFSVGARLAIYKGMLRIRRKANGEVIFTLSGQIDREHIAELEQLIGAEGKDRRIILDLKDMTLTGQDGITFLAQCEAAGIRLVNCDPYVREWIVRQGAES